MYNEHLYQWVFHFNPFTKKWSGINRTDWSNYWGGYSTDSIIKGDTMEEVIKLIKEHENKRSDSK